MSKAHSYSHPCDFGSAQSPCYFRCLSLSKAHSYSSSLWFRLRSITVLYPFKIPIPELVEGTFSIIFSVISAPHNHRLIFTTTFGAWACRRHILIPLPCDFDSAQSPCYIYYYSRCLSLSKARSPSSSLWFLLRSITALYLLLHSVPELVEGTENWCLSLSKAHSYSSSLLIFNFPGNLSF